MNKKKTPPDPKNHPPPTPSSLLTVKEVASLLHVPTSWVYAHSRNDSIPQYRIGKYVRFSRPAIEQWLTSGCPKYHPGTTNPIAWPLDSQDRQP